MSKDHSIFIMIIAKLTALCQTTSPFFSFVSVNGINGLLVSHIWNLGVNFASNFSFALDIRTTTKSIHLFNYNVSRSHPLSSPFSIIFFFYSLFPHPFFPQSKSYLQFKVLVRPHLHQKVHTSWISSFSKPQNHGDSKKNVAKEPGLNFDSTIHCPLCTLVNHSFLRLILSHIVATGTNMVMEMKSFWTMKHYTDIKVRFVAGRITQEQRPEPQVFTIDIILPWGQECWLCGQMTWVWISALLLTSCMKLRKLS